MPPRKFRDRRTCVFIGTDLSYRITAEDIASINKKAIPIKRRAFFNNIRPNVLDDLRKRHDFDIRRQAVEDRAMSFFRSEYHDQPCYCARWLGLLWVFGPKE